MLQSVQTVSPVLELELQANKPETEQQQDQNKLEKSLEKTLHNYNLSGKIAVIIEAAVAFATFYWDGGYRTDYIAHGLARLAEVVREFAFKDDPKKAGMVNLAFSIPGMLLAGIKPLAMYLKQGIVRPKLTAGKIATIALNTISAPIGILFSWPIAKFQRTLAPIYKVLLTRSSESKLSSFHYIRNKKLKPEDPKANCLFEETMESGMAHWHRGYQTVMLALSQGVGNLIPWLNPFIETAAGLFVSGLSVYEGLGKLQNKTNPQTQVKQWEQGSFGDKIYKLGEFIFGKLYRLSIPKLDLVKKLQDNPFDNETSRSFVAALSKQKKTPPKRGLN